jgi:hypothetical protein
MNRRAARWLIAIALGITAPSWSTRASADELDDRIAELSSQLAAKKSDRERIAAVTELGRIGEKRTLKPLVVALRDKNATVRAVAALALGKLGHRAALPALREASNDDDSLVRKRAREAVIKVSEANGIEMDAAGTRGASAATAAVKPDLYVVVKSASDDSPDAQTVKKAAKAKAVAKKGGAADGDKDRRHHAEIARKVMTSELRAAPAVTCAAKEADRHGLDARHIDVSISKLETRTAGAYVEVEAQLRLAISDDRGKMLSVLTGGAKVQVNKASYDAAYLPQLRREAIENAVRGMFDKLLAHLRRGDA